MASKFGVEVKCRRSHTELAKQLLYTKVFSDGVFASVWGLQHETDGLEAYKATLEPGSTVQDVGIYMIVIVVIVAFWEHLQMTSLLTTLVTLYELLRLNVHMRTNGNDWNSHNVILLSGLHLSLL